MGTMMCGIAGVVRFDGRPEAGHVAVMLKCLEHRGPDGQGLWRDRHVCLGHRRLSVLDLSTAANQPMIDDSERYVIVFNGEIYNFRELRDGLLDAGEAFKTTGDTEVLLKLFRRDGPACLQKLNGMFAFAVWDREEHVLFMARDRMGEKPLYYAFLAGGGVAFASEMKALRTHPDIRVEIDPCSLGRYLAAGYTLGERTIIKSISRLPPASFMKIGPEKPAVLREYWSLASAFKRRFDGSLAQAESTLRDLLEDSTRLRLESDVPLGAFLSGGVDSAGVVDGMRQVVSAEQIRAYTIGFRERTYSEIAEARSSADVLGVSLREHEVYPSMLEDVPRIFDTADEPFADTSIIPTFYLARFARQEVTVALTGDGGDELFGGYETYVADRIHRTVSRIPRPLLRGLATIVSGSLPVTRNRVSLDYKIRQFLNSTHLDFRRAHWSWRTIFDEVGRRQILTRDWADLAASEDGFGLVNRLFDAVAEAHPLDQAIYVDMKTWLADNILVKVDRATMACSLESRAPYLDHRLVEFAASLPADWKLRGTTKKYVLRRALGLRLPASLLNRKKRGFNAPAAHWVVGPLKSLLMDAVSSKAARGLIEVSRVEGLLKEHEAGQDDHGFRLFNILSLSLWLSRPPDAGSSASLDQPSAVAPLP
jgi:asparagine synthase (glutamine-hydrolysing)